MSLSLVLHISRGPKRLFAARSTQVFIIPISFPSPGESASPANTCYLGPEFVSQIPRVWYYVRRARGTAGGRLVLPCRVLDQGVAMTTVWHFRGVRLMPGLNDHKYEVRAAKCCVVVLSQRVLYV